MAMRSLRWVLALFLLNACDKQEVKSLPPSPAVPLPAASDGLPEPLPARPPSPDTRHVAPNVKELRTLQGIESSSWAVALMPSEKHLLLARNSDGLKIVDLESALSVKAFPEYFTVTALAVMPDGKQAVINRLIDNVPSQSLLDLRTGKIAKTYYQGRTDTMFVGVIGRGEHVICGGADVRIYRRESGEEVSKLKLADGQQACGWAPKGDTPLIVTMRRTGAGLRGVEFGVYDHALGKEVCTFHGPEKQYLESVALLPDAGLIITLFASLVLKKSAPLGPPGWEYFLHIRSIGGDRFLWERVLDYYADKILAHPDGRRFFLIGREIHEWQLFDP